MRCQARIDSMIGARDCSGSRMYARASAEMADRQLTRHALVGDPHLIGGDDAQAFVPSQSASRPQLPCSRRLPPAASVSVISP
jgi:hypothetical protein